MKHLIVKANTNASFEDIDVVILKLDDETIKSIETLKRLTLEFAKNKEVKSAIFNETTFFFYGHEFKNTNNVAFDDLASFVVVDDIDEEDFSDPETHLDAYQITLDKEGFKLRAWGEYTGDEFFSERVDYKKFAKALKK